jgi:hypothetical protein
MYTSCKYRKLIYEQGLRARLRLTDLPPPAFIQFIGHQSPHMLVVMAVYTEVFPVRTVRGIVFVVPVLVVHGEEVAVLVIELAGALGADKTVNL